MEQTNSLYKYLYQTLTIQLQNGSFHQGQQFPSQREICLQYNVGITTVRKVMKLLDEHGYVRTVQGKPSIVTYQASKEAQATVLVQRQNEIADAFRGLELIMPALYCEGAKQCKAPELRFFYKLLDSISDQMELADHYRLANAFYTALLRPLKNQLIMDLELDSENYLHVPYLLFPGVENPFATTVERTRVWLNSAIYQIEHKQYSAFYEAAAKLYWTTGERVNRYLCALSKYVSATPQQEEDIFWFRIKDRSELYSRLAMTLIRRMVAGEYDDQKYLPSIPMLMEEYGVMKGTARRAIALLNALGFAQTIDKKGTIIATTDSAPIKSSFNLADPLIQERVSLCLDALQIVSITARSCTASVPSVPEQLAASFEKRLLTAPESKFVTLSFHLLINSFIQLLPYHSLSNIFSQLDDLIIWGHYLQTLDASFYLDYNLDYNKVAPVIDAVIAALKSQNSGRLQDAFHNAFTLLYENLSAVVSQLPYNFKPDRYS